MDAVEGSDAFVQQLVAFIKEKVIEFIKSVFTGGVKSLFRGVFSAFLGLLLGVLAGFALAAVYRFLNSTTVPADPAAGGGGGTGIRIYMVVVGALGGIVLGWWFGLRAGIRKTVVMNPVMPELVNSMTDQVFNHLAAKGIRGREQVEALRQIQGAIEAKRAEIKESITSSLWKIPLLGGVAARFSNRIFKWVMKMPDMMFLDIDLSVEIGDDPRQKVKDSVIPKMEETLGEMVNGAFVQPILVSTIVVVIFTALPFVLLIF